jgi:hypothetical protein
MCEVRLPKCSSADARRLDFESAQQKIDLKYHIAYLTLLSKVTSKVMIMPRLFNLVAYGIGVPLMMTERTTTQFGTFQKIAIAFDF